MKALLLLVLLCVNAWALEARIAEAEKLFRAGQQAEAKRIVAQYITSNENAKAYIDVAHLYARLKKWPDAVHYLEIAANREPKNALAWYELGLVQHQNKNIDEAVASIRKSISISSKTPKSVLALGEILEFAQDHYDARLIYIDGIKKVGPLPEFYTRLCWLNYQDAFYAEAIKQCSLAVKANPKDVQSWALLGKAYFDHQERDKAFKTFATATQKFPRASLVFRARGIIYYQEKSYEQAVLDLGKAFGIDADDDEAGIHLARSLFELGNYEHALPVYIEVCRLNRTYRFDLLAKQRELFRKSKEEMAARYQEELDRL